MARILIIEDEPAVREAVGAVITSAGHEAHLAPDGEQGLRRYRTVQPDLVITDIIMPEMDGLGTIRELRRLRPTLPIIAMSGGARLGELNYLKAARELGASRTLPKPISPAAMLSAIQELLPTAE